MNQHPVCHLRLNTNEKCASTLTTRPADASVHLFLFIFQLINSKSEKKWPFIESIFKLIKNKRETEKKRGTLTRKQ